MNKTPELVLNPGDLLETKVSIGFVFHAQFDSELKTHCKIIWLLKPNHSYDLDENEEVNCKNIEEVQYHLSEKPSWWILINHLND